MELKDVFNQYSQDYDANRKHFIPCYEIFYQSVVSILNFETDSPKILDLGAGTGLLSAFVLAKYPKAQLTLIDQAEEMLEFSRRRFSDLKTVKYIAADYTRYGYNEKYDAIISALSLHHLEDEKKKALFKSCYSNLVSGGIFVDADQVLSPYPEVEDKVIAIWHNWVKDSKVSEKELAAFYQRTSFDKTAPLNAQLEWLIEAGFKNTDCIFKYLNFAVFFGVK